MKPCGLRDRIRSTSRGKSCCGEARRADLGVEVHQRDVHRLGQRVEELDGRRARQLDVLPHAAAGVEQQAQVQRRRGLGIVPGGEVGHRLRHAVFAHLEIVACEARADATRRGC